MYRCNVLKEMFHNTFDVIQQGDLIEEFALLVYDQQCFRAADDVSPDYYSKDELVATVTTDANGVAEVSDLPVGNLNNQAAQGIHGGYRFFQQSDI